MPLSLENVAQIVVRLSRSRIEFQRPAIRRDGFHEAALGGERHAKVGIKVRDGRRNADGTTNQFHGDLMPAALVRDDS